MTHPCGRISHSEAGADAIKLAHPSMQKLLCSLARGRSPWGAVGRHPPGGWCRRDIELCADAGVAHSGPSGEDLENTAEERRRRCLMQPIINHARALPIRHRYTPRQSRRQDDAVRDGVQWYLRVAASCSVRDLEIVAQEWMILDWKESQLVVMSLQLNSDF